MELNLEKRKERNIKISIYKCVINIKIDSNHNLPNELKDDCISDSPKTFLGKFVISEKAPEPSVRLISTKSRTAASSSLGLNV